MLGVPGGSPGPAMESGCAQLRPTRHSSEDSLILRRAKTYLLADIPTYSPAYLLAYLPAYVPICLLAYLREPTFLGVVEPQRARCRRRQRPNPDGLLIPVEICRVCRYPVPCFGLAWYAAEPYDCGRMCLLS